jgi:uncharacterized protein (TIGR02466 family)
MPEIFNCFPLTVFKDTLDLAPDYRHRLGERVIAAWRDGPKAGQDARNSWTGDRNGAEALHHDPEFAGMFQALHVRLHRYLEALSVNGRMIELFYTRAWGTISVRGQSIRRHRHNQSHISLVYYPLKAPNSGNLVFHNAEPFNEFTPGLFEPHAQQQGLLTQSNILNSEMVNLPVVEDNVVIFPSKIYHATEPNQTEGPRVSISVDVVVALKDATGVEYLMPPVRNWRGSGEF